MVSDFQRHAVRMLVEKATAAGIPVPVEVASLAIDGHTSMTGALLWVQAHPDDDWASCCIGGGIKGPEYCTCWEPVYELDQAEPRPPQCPDDLQVQRRVCGDCAFRPDSPERADEFSAEALLDLAASGTPFWCHQGMRRPLAWRHPDGRTVPGDPADWTPPKVRGIPYQADGSPGLLCAGWAARAARARADVAEQDLLERAIALCVAERSISITMLQRKWRLNAAQAIRLLEAMTARGIIHWSDELKAYKVNPEAV